jgi:hypothetical protein
MTEPRTFGFSSFCVSGLIVSCAALGLCGAIGAFTTDGTILGADRVGCCVTAFAFVIGFAILNVNTMSEALLDAINIKVENWNWPTVISAALALLIFAVSANIGIHLGWDILVTGPGQKISLKPWAIDAAFLALSFAKPLARMAVAGRQAAERARVSALHQAEQANRNRVNDDERDKRHVERLAEIEAKARIAAPVPAPVSTPPKTSDNVTPIKRAAKTALATGLSLGAGAQAAHAEPVTPAAPRAPIVSESHAGADAQVARAVSLRDAGMVRAEVARQMDCSERTVTRLWGKAAAANAMALAS